MVHVSIAGMVWCWEESSQTYSTGCKACDRLTLLTLPRLHLPVLTIYHDSICLLIHYHDSIYLFIHYHDSIYLTMLKENLLHMQSWRQQGCFNVHYHYNTTGW